MIIGILKETYPGERRVALIPASVPPLKKAGFRVLVEPGSGQQAGYSDEEYADKGAEIVGDRAEVFRAADVILQVRGLGANLQEGRKDLEFFRQDQIVIGLLEPLSEPEALKMLADRGVTAFALELLPRITRAQNMDVLSSMATVAGYKAVLLAAEALPRMFPLLMTAAGTIAPAKVFVVGAGVAGLQAIATARRLGALVSAYDVRAAVRDQVQSLGAKFVELPMEAADAETDSGYARELGESFYRRQREMMMKVVAESDVVITTAAVPGRKAPLLVTEEMVRGMQPGSLVLDLAAERGGNCELTKPGETVVVHGVTILGPLNLAATVPYHSSQMFAKNISNFLLHLCKGGKPQPDSEDEIIRSTLVTRGGRVMLKREGDEQSSSN